MKCDNCFCTESYIKDYEHVYSIKGREIKFSSKRRFCKECNNLIYDKTLDNEAGQIAIEIYNKKYGISSDSIIELRKNYNLSQDQFSKIIGCAKKTLISYEKGKSLPNENYVILINSLIEKPNIIETLIDSNPKNFTSKEYDKIKQKIARFISNNSTNLENFIDFEPIEYNGYTALNHEKVVNMILLFAEKGVLVTKLMKEMFYADFLHYKQTGTSITGLQYAKIAYGPVPDGKDIIIGSCIAKNYIREEIEYKNDYVYHNIIGLKKVNNSVFDEEELSIMNKVKEYFKNFKSKEIADFSHEEKAYTETGFAEIISYDHAFDINRIN